MIRSLLGHLFAGLDRRFGAPNLLRIALIWLALTSLASGLIPLIESIQEYWIFWTVFVGLMSGWMLARMRLSGFKYSLWIIFLGASWLLLTIGRIFVPLGALLSNWLSLYNQVAFHHTPFAALQTETLIKDWNILTAGLDAIQKRLGEWIGGVTAGVEVIDPIIRTMSWASVVWLVAAWAVWFIRRRGNVILGLLPATALLAYNIYYTNFKSSLIWLVLLGGSIVLLQAVDGYRASNNRWLASRLDRAELEITLMVFVLVLSLTLMLAGLVTPSISIKDIRDTVHNILEVRHNEQFAKSLGLEQAPDINQLGSSSSRPGPLTSVLIVGPGPKLSQNVVMLVTVDGFVPSAPTIYTLNLPQPVTTTFYWRSQTFERYTGSGWVTSMVASTSNPASQPLLPGLAGPLPANYRLVRAHVEQFTDATAPLFVIGELISADQPFKAAWRDQGDLIGAETESSNYVVNSRVQAVTISQLRAAGETYPPEICNYYLQLPSDLPRRVRDLALSITANQATRYDQAAAIEAYLRTFPYSLEVPAPPLGRDVADYFLFDLKKGYCNYYATTMVVMARAAGLPARLVIGYASNSYNFQNNQFVVREADAHAWPEIYFPGIGWVEFEPTAGSPAIERPSGVQRPAATSTPPVPSASQGILHRLLLINPEILHQAAVIFTAAFVLALLYLFLPIERLVLLLHPADQAVALIFRRLYNLGRRWGIEARAARTPQEFAGELSIALTSMAGNNRLKTSLSSITTDANWLIDLYSRLQYSPHPLASAEQHRAIRTWYRLSRQLFWIRLGTAFSRAKNRQI